MNLAPRRIVLAPLCAVDSGPDSGSRDAVNSKHFPKVPTNHYVDLSDKDYLDGTSPGSFLELSRTSFVRQLRTIARPSRPNEPPESLQFILSNAAVAATEANRISSGEAIEANPASFLLYKAGCTMLDTFFDERPIQRFWFLETIARIPYFSYVSMLHFYESLGFWRAPDLRKIHNAEEYNELHHLLIMESLGGNAQWSDRFLGYHTAILYYWFLVGVFAFSPRVAYQFMELLEAHAVDTYSTFVAENRERLAALSAPTVASAYYKAEDLYMFDDFQVSHAPGSRRPPCDTLLDVFNNICDDEAEHVKTMQACQDYARFRTRETEVVSPHLAWENKGPSSKTSDSRDSWNRWAADINTDSGLQRRQSGSAESM